jgi:hypothetical protein
MKLAHHQLLSVRTIVGLFLLVTLMGWSALSAAPSSTSTQTGPNLDGLGSIFGSISSEVCTDVFPCSRCQPTITSTPNSTQTITSTESTTVTGSPVTSTLSTTSFTTLVINQTLTATLFTTSNISATFTTFIPDMNGVCSVSVGGTDSASSYYIYSIISGGTTFEFAGEDYRTCVGLSIV